MTVPMGSTGSGVGMYAGPSAASETDGETYDDHTDYGDFDSFWDYPEMFTNLSKNVKTYVVQPIVIGAAAAFGMSLGYAIFDATASLFSGKRGSQKPR